MGIDSLFDLTGKVALVTGASRGLGKAMALALAEAGADLALNARSADSLKQVSEEIQRLGRKVALVPGDVSDEAQAAEFVKAAHQQFGKLDILVNNAGVWEGTYFLRISKADWDKVMQVNLTGAFLVAKAVARIMLKQHSGKIINVSSVLGMRGALQSVAYCVAKGGIIQMTRVMAMEMGSAGIQVNCLAPGLIATDMTREYTEDKEVMAGYLSKVPLRRFGQPEELAGAVVFLASKASDLMTGSVLVIDGGESLV